MSAVEKVQDAAKSADVIVVNFYRGAWCPVCKAWLQKFAKDPQFAALRQEMNIVAFAVSSDAVENASSTQKAFGFGKRDDLVFANDPSNELAKLLNEKFSGSNIVIDKTPSSWKNHFTSYENGYTQAATVSFKIVDGEWVELYSWAK